MDINILSTLKTLYVSFFSHFYSGLVPQCSLDSDPY